MIVSMKRYATKAEIEAVCERIRDFNYKIHAIEGEERVVIGAVGVGDVTTCLESLEAMACVEKAVRISAPYKFVSKEFRSTKTIIRVNGGTGVEIGGDECVVTRVQCSFAANLMADHAPISCCWRRFGERFLEPGQRLWQLH